MLDYSPDNPPYEASPAWVMERITHLYRVTSVYSIDVSASTADASI